MEAQVGVTAPCEFNQPKHTIRYNTTPYLSCKGYGGGVGGSEKHDRHHLQCHMALVPIRQASYSSLGSRQRDGRTKDKNAQIVESTQRVYAVSSASWKGGWVLENVMQFIIH